MMAGLRAAAWRGDSCRLMAQLMRVDPTFLHRLNSNCAHFWAVLSSHLPRGCGQCTAGQGGEGAAPCCRGDLMLAEQGWGWVWNR